MVTPNPVAMYRARQTTSPDQEKVNGANTTPAWIRLHQRMCDQLSRGQRFLCRVLASRRVVMDELLGPGYPLPTGGNGMREAHTPNGHFQVRARHGLCPPGIGGKLSCASHSSRRLS